jgi:hypothetical protein
MLLPSAITTGTWRLIGGWPPQKEKAAHAARPSKKHEDRTLVVILVVIVIIIVAVVTGVIIEIDVVIVVIIAIGCFLDLGFLLDHFDRSPALAGGRGRGLCVLLVDPALRTNGDFTAEVIELRLTAEANVLGAKVGHVSPLSPQKAPQR